MRRLYALTELGRENTLKAKRGWAERNKDQKRANVTLNNAVRDGKVIAMPCVKCGKKAQGHHEDYSKPLDVVWLCSKHHAERHREIRDARRVTS